MQRRSFLKNIAAGTLASSAVSGDAPAPTPPMKITRIRFYHNPLSRPIFNQSYHIVTVETDAGIT
ncbi:MAG: mandelate racemase/muconate lactonizing enzyme family protein, partial [Bryobacteraceae bacterium]